MDITELEEGKHITWVNQPISAPKELKTFLKQRTHIFCLPSHVAMQHKEGGLSGQIKGVYIIYAASNSILYIGMATNLRQRLRGHFRIFKPDSLCRYKTTEGWLLNKNPNIDTAGIMIIVFPIKDSINRAVLELELLRTIPTEYNIHNIKGGKYEPKRADEAHEHNHKGDGADMSDVELLSTDLKIVWGKLKKLNLESDNTKEAISHIKDAINLLIDKGGSD